MPVQVSGFHWLHFLQVWSPALLRRSSNSFEDVEHWYVIRMFSWVSRHPERVYGEGWETETKNKDTGKKMLELIIIEYKQGLVWG